MIKLELTEQDAQRLLQLMDAGLRSIGLTAAIDAAALVQKIDAAAQAARAEAKDAAKQEAA